MNSKPCSYFEGVSLKRVAILGIEPPPLGGVSVHISRVMDRFSLQDNKVFLFNTEKKRRFFAAYALRLFLWLLAKRPDHLYYHSTYLKTSILELWFLRLLKWPFGYQLHIVDHDCRHLAKRTQTMRWIYRRIVRASASVICIGKSTLDSYTSFSIEGGMLQCQDAFLPPIVRHAGLIKANYPSSLKIFMQDHTPLLAISVAHLMRIDGIDMYGVDFAINLIASIADEYPDAGLIIAMPSIADRDYFNQLQEHMRKVGVAERIYILHGNNELWPLYASIDLFIRPTRTDGDSISVREALYFGVPVVASDIVVRPEGVYCFKVEDENHAALITKKVLRECVYGSKRKRDFVHAQSIG